MDNELKVVVGLGKTGLSCVRYLKAQNMNIAVVDSRNEPPLLAEFKESYADVPIYLGKFDETVLDRASEIIISPGISLHEPEIAKQRHRGIPIVGDIELFARRIKKKVVGITGSNGKSTVTSMIGYLAQQAGLNVKVGGNLGTPALDLLDHSEADLYVLELSSFQLESTYSLETFSAVNLNISPDHMDRYKTLEDYKKAKLRIYQRCEHPIINQDDPQSYDSFPFTTRPIAFSLREPLDGVFGLRKFHGEYYLSYGQTPLLSTKNLLLKGQHQYANALASLAMGTAIGLPLNEMLQSITTFKGLIHRCQWLGRDQGVDWYNDSKATNVGSTLAAILGIGPEIVGKLVVLAGGQGKNADFSELYDPIKAYVKTLILFGEDKQKMAKALKGAAPIIDVQDIYHAVEAARRVAQEGDAVILSPACASYDMFKNFEHRGEVFMKIVRGFIS